MENMENYTNDNTSTEGSHDATSIETTIIVNCSIMALLIPISIIGNSLVLAAITRTPSLRSPSIVFLCSLAVSDLIVGFIVQPLYIASELTKSYIVKYLAETIAYAACGFSLFTITAISVDRFVAVYYHMRYPTLVTTLRAMLLSVILCVVNVLASLIYFWNRTVYLFVVATGICICLLISTVSFIRIFRIVRRHQVQIHAQQQAVQSPNAAMNNNMAQLKKSAMNTFVFYIFMILCYFPVVLSLYIYNLSFKNWTNAWNFADTATLMNSSINPILYCWRLRELRTAVVKTARQMLCKSSTEWTENI